MGRYKIIVCKGCGDKFPIYTYEVYPGDPDYCRRCNRGVQEKEEKLPKEEE